MDHSRCPNCGQPLPHKPGRSGDCKRAVRKEQNRRSYEKHRETIRAKQREYREANPLKVAASAVKSYYRQRHKVELPEVLAEGLAYGRLIKREVRARGDHA